MKRSLGVMLIVLLMLPLAVIAQDATPTLPPEEQPVEELPPVEGIPEEVVPLEEVEPNLEIVTADPASFYGQEVTFEGVVTELVNIRAFVLGEGAALDDDQVLVLNNSGQEFSIELTRDARVQVTGTIYPAWDQGGWDQVMMLPMGGMNDLQTGTTTDDQSGEMAATEEAGMEATEEPMAEPMSSNSGGAMSGITLASFPMSVLETRFPSHTLLVFDSPDDIAILEPVEAE